MITRLLDFLDKIPAWILMIVCLSLVGLIGLLDYETGDYSILIFYAIPVALVAWCIGDWAAIVAVVASGCARYNSDYFSYQNRNISYWNLMSDMLFLLIFGLLVSNIRRVLENEKKGRG